MNLRALYSVCYNESLNRQIQEQQMGLLLQYWYNKTGQAVSRYYGSEFQMHGDPETLSENLLTGTADLPEEKLIQTAMDGLYVMDAPARRAEYMRRSVTGLYPKKFCVIRWVENEPIADRVIIIWNYIVPHIKAFESKAPSKRPKDNKSYDNLVKYHLNPLILVYLHLFRDVVNKLNVFLNKFQTDSPMVLFLSGKIAIILKWAMRFFVQRSTLKKADTPY